MPPDEALRLWVERWVRLADGDLELARIGLAAPDYDVYELIGFHTQQAVEKLIKAYLARNSVSFEDQHSFDYLQSRVRSVDADLARRIDAAAALNRYAVGTRYPGQYGPVSREAVVDAVRIAEQVRAEILPLLADPPQEGSLRERWLRHRAQKQKEEGPPT